jgi:RNA polymerase sigma-70 factor (ECF subfamily)
MNNIKCQALLYHRYKQKMFLVCLRYSNSREEAEEVLQEGFIKMFSCIGQYKNAGSFEGWVRKIMVNCALQKHRSKKKLHAVPFTQDHAIENIPVENISSRLGTKELLEMIQQLPPSYKMVFNLYVFEGMKHREIADMLSISEGTSKSNLSAARSILQNRVNGPQIRKMKYFS